MNIGDFRKQYPEYDDMDDISLATALYNKEYTDMPKESFLTAFGVSETEELSPQQAMKESLGDESLSPQEAQAKRLKEIDAEKGRTPDDIDYAFRNTADVVGKKIARSSSRVGANLVELGKDAYDVVGSEVTKAFSSDTDPVDSDVTTNILESTSAEDLYNNEIVKTNLKDTLRAKEKTIRDDKDRLISQVVESARNANWGLTAEDEIHYDDIKDINGVLNKALALVDMTLGTVADSSGDLMNIAINSPSYIFAYGNQKAKEIAKNQGQEKVTPELLAVGIADAVIQAYSDKLALGYAARATSFGKLAKAAMLDGTLEVPAELIDAQTTYYGTEQNLTPEQIESIGVTSFLAGGMTSGVVGVMPATVGTIKGKLEERAERKNLQAVQDENDRILAGQKAATAEAESSRVTQADAEIAEFDRVNAPGTERIYNEKTTVPDPEGYGHLTKAGRIAEVEARKTEVQRMDDINDAVLQGTQDTLAANLLINENQASRDMMEGFTPKDTPITRGEETLEGYDVLLPPTKEDLKAQKETERVTKAAEKEKVVADKKIVRTERKLERERKAKERLQEREVKRTTRQNQVKINKQLKIDEAETKAVEKEAAVAKATKEQAKVVKETIATESQAPKDVDAMRAKVLHPYAKSLGVPVENPETGAVVPIAELRKQVKDTLGVQEVLAEAVTEVPVVPVIPKVETKAEAPVVPVEQLEAAKEVIAPKVEPKVEAPVVEAIITEKPVEPLIEDTYTKVPTEPMLMKDLNKADGDVVRSFARQLKIKGMDGDKHKTLKVLRKEIYNKLNESKAPEAPKVESKVSKRKPRKKKEQPDINLSDIELKESYDVDGETVVVTQTAQQVQDSIKERIETAEELKRCIG